MPFDPFMPQPLTATTIRGNAPAVSGVFGLSNAREWIYIGETDNIQAALLGLLQGGDQVLMTWRPTGFVFEACTAAGRVSRQGRLVVEYRPACNQRPQKP